MKQYYRKSTSKKITNNKIHIAPFNLYHDVFLKTN
jgi:hypothetical protein